jgi:hypothetical protein
MSANSAGSMYYREGPFSTILGHFGQRQISAKTTEKPWFIAFIGGCRKKGIASEDRCSIQLSYGRDLDFPWFFP